MMDNRFNLLKTNVDNMTKSGDKDGFLQKGTRRSKNDKTNRDYICGCTKTYLSYPALYTHIKNKHNGIAPQGTMLGKPDVEESEDDEQSELNLNSEMPLSKRDNDGEPIAKSKNRGRLIRVHFQTLRR